MTMAAIMDGALALLLCATCVYCVMLNKRLRSLKAGQDELQAAIAVFDKAAASVSATLERVEAAGLDQTRDLDHSLDKASAMAAELSVMVSAGDNIAGRIERAVDDVRALGKRGARPPLKECA
ncbi:MAG: DUF6468 domain-containing protein [Pseudomonadota bacterium]